jgi:hypothetical protein
VHDGVGHDARDDHHNQTCKQDQNLVGVQALGKAGYDLQRQKKSRQGNKRQPFIF